MYAVVATGGKQYKVTVGEEVFVEKLEGDEGASVTFDNVLAVGGSDEIQVGAKVGKASVTAEIVKHGKGKKITVLKYKAKKGYRRKAGHRQPYTKVRITAINA